MFYLLEFGDRYIALKKSITCKAVKSVINLFLTHKYAL